MGASTVLFKIGFPLATMQQLTRCRLWEGRVFGHLSLVFPGFQESKLEMDQARVLLDVLECEVFLQVFRNRPQPVSISVRQNLCGAGSFLWRYGSIAASGRDESAE